jgi:hypothetical protein
MNGQLHALAALPPGKNAPFTRWILGLLYPKAALDDMEKLNFFTLPGLELCPFNRPGRSRLLYRANEIELRQEISA